MLIIAADGFEKTDHQKELISFLKDQKDINDIAPGTAGFDIDEMPWQHETLVADVDFLIRVSEEAQRESTFKKLPYEISTEIVLPWLERFVFLIDKMTTEDLCIKLAFAEDPMMKNNEDYCFRVISNQVRFGCGYRTVNGKRQYFAWHGYPDRNSDYFTTAEISESEFKQINKKYPEEIVADRKQAEEFRNAYVDNHPVILEGWDRLL